MLSLVLSFIASRFPARLLPIRELMMLLLIIARKDDAHPSRTSIANQGKLVRSIGRFAQVPSDPVLLELHYKP